MWQHDNDGALGLTSYRDAHTLPATATGRSVSHRLLGQPPAARSATGRSASPRRWGTASELGTERLSRLLTYAVITQAAMGGTGRPENLAGETVLKFHGLAVDDDFLGSGRRAVPPGTAAVGDVCGEKEREHAPLAELHRGRPRTPGAWGPPSRPRGTVPFRESPAPGHTNAPRAGGRAVPQLPAPSRLGSVVTRPGRWEWPRD